MQRLEVSGAVRPIFGSLGVKRLTVQCCSYGNATRYNGCIKSHEAIPASFWTTTIAHCFKFRVFKP